MTEREKEVLKYRDYPEGSGGKAIYDSIFLPFQKYLIKYYKSPSETRKASWQKWQKWQVKYLEPAFNERKHEEMIKNFGYVSIDKYDFESQYLVYQELKLDKRLDDEIRKFIGFLAGNHFFKDHDINCQQWFDMKNWSNPIHSNKNGKTINKILEYTYGINMLKVNFPEMPYWKRF